MKATIIFSCLVGLLQPFAYAGSEGLQICTSHSVEYLLAHLHEDSDRLHSEISPASMELVEKGLPVMTNGVLELLISDNHHDRIKGQYILGKTFERHQRAKSERTLDQIAVLAEIDVIWKRNGPYDSEGTQKARYASYLKWQAWIKKEMLAPKQ